MNTELFEQLLGIAQKSVDQSATHDGLQNCDILSRARAELQYEKSKQEKEKKANSNALQQCEAQAQSIAKMVAALECDFARLIELTEERDGYVHSMTGDSALDTPEQWIIDNPEAAEELAELIEAANGCADYEEAREEIENDPLSIEVRSDWNPPGFELEMEEFQILLCTGGPAVRICGELDHNNEPCRAWLEYQDWFTPWTEYHDSVISHETLLSYCRVFYFSH